MGFLKYIAKSNCKKFFWRDQIPWEWKRSKKVRMAGQEMRWLGGWTYYSDYLEKSVLARDLVGQFTG